MGVGWVRGVKKSEGVVADEGEARDGRWEIRSWKQEAVGSLVVRVADIVT